MGIVFSVAHLIRLIRKDYDGTKDTKIKEKFNFQNLYCFYHLDSTASFSVVEFAPTAIPITSPQILLVNSSKRRNGFN